MSLLLVTRQESLTRRSYLWVRGTQLLIISEGGVKLFSRLRLQDMCNSASCYHTDYRCCRGQPQMCISLPAGVKCQWSTIGWEATSSDAFPDPCNGVRNLY
jgi:hypothetical protein